MTRMADSDQSEDRKLKILVVDDDPVIRALLEDYFSAINYRVEVATGGVECLSRLEKLSPDVLVIDFQMPDMTGLELLKHIRQTTLKRSVPVILVSANSDMALLAAEGGARADAYLQKPFDLHEMRAVVERLAERRESTPPPLG